MNRRLVPFALTAFFMVPWILGSAALAQAPSNPLRDSQPSTPAAVPDPSVVPQVPTLERRAPQQPAANPQRQPDAQPGMQPGGQPAAQGAPQQAAPPPMAPFTLTPQEQAEVDRVLKLWEENNSKIKTFDCSFSRWVYDAVFGKRDEKGNLVARFIELGTIKYATPDHGMFRVESERQDAALNGKIVPIDDTRAEHWVCDGKSIFEFKHQQKQLVEHKLPPELQGKAISNTPLPFLFGADAQKLQQRYWIHILPDAGGQGQICLEAHPRFQQEAANFSRAQFIVNTKDMSPFALRIIQPNGKDYTVYRFYDIVVNDQLKLFKVDPFRPSTPFGWQKIVEQAPAKDAAQTQNPGPTQSNAQEQARRPASGGNR
jgi:TIGR03009 family protein